jgi:outer membrane protein assembly factor BamB
MTCTFVNARRSACGSFLAHLMKTLVCKTFAVALCLISIVAGHAQEWTRFRGPNGTGISEAKTIPTQWTESDFNWKVALPGVGHSSPVLWGDKVFVTSADERRMQFVVLCLKANDGSVLWQKEFSFTPHRKHANNTFATSTPTVDAGRVYVCRMEPAHNYLFALDHSGALVWEKDLGPYRTQHSGGASPILHDGMVVLANEQDGESFLIAVDAKTGEPRWKTPRKSGDSAAAYSTPCVYQPKQGQPVLIFNSEMHGISAVAPGTGKVVWEFLEAFDKRSVSSPVVAGDLLIGSCGSGGGGNFVVAVRPGDPVRNKKPERAYEIRRSAPYVPTSVCLGDRLFLWSDAGIVSSVVASTGEVKWQERVGGNFFSSPVWVDGRLLCVSRNGEVVVVAAGDKFEVLARNPLNELTHSTPAVAGGRMYIHTSQHLISIGGKAKPGEKLDAGGT